MAAVAGAGGGGLGGGGGGLGGSGGGGGGLGSSGGGRDGDKDELSHAEYLQKQIAIKKVSVRTVLRTRMHSINILFSLFFFWQAEAEQLNKELAETAARHKREQEVINSLSPY